MKKLLCVLVCAILVSVGAYYAYDFILTQMIQVALTIASDSPIDASVPFHDMIASMREELISHEKTTSEATPDVPEEQPQASAASTPTPTSTPAPSEASGVHRLVKNLSPSDRSFVMNIYGRFSASEISSISKMMENGITPEEKKAIKSIVYAKVSSGEIQRLMEISKKM